MSTSETARDKSIGNRSDSEIVNSKKGNAEMEKGDTDDLKKESQTMVTVRNLIR